MRPMPIREAAGGLSADHIRAAGDHGARHAPSRSDRLAGCAGGAGAAAGAAAQCRRRAGSLRKRTRANSSSGCGHAYRARAAAEPDRIVVDRCEPIGRRRSRPAFSNCSRRDHGFLERRFAALAAGRAAAPARRARGRATAAFVVAAVRAGTRRGATGELDHRAGLVRVARPRGPAACAPPAGCCARTAIRIPMSCVSRRTRSKSRSIRCASLIESLTLKSYRGGYKVGVIEGAEALNANGANAFLKTLEEPTANTVLIMIARPSHRLPATIASRCLRLTLRPPSTEAAARVARGPQATSAGGAIRALGGGAGARRRRAPAGACNWTPRARGAGCRTCANP